jgi:hypothetical protein
MAATMPVRCVLWSREAELFEINASGFDRGSREHSDGGDALGLEVEALFEDGFEFGIVVQGYCSSEGIW